MDILLISGYVVGIIAGIIGIIAGYMQIRTIYVQKSHQSEKKSKNQDGQTASFSTKRQIPNNLSSHRANSFIGREPEKRHVHRMLLSDTSLVSIEGIGGIGKTSLALEVAHECIKANTDGKHSNDIAIFHGIVWTTDEDKNLNLNTILNKVAQTLELAHIVQLPLDEKRLTVRKVLQENPYLLIVDNFDTIKDRKDEAKEINAFLKDLPEPSKALITTREQNPLGAETVTVKALGVSEALTFARSIGKQIELESIVKAEDHKLLTIYEATGGAPLAIKWVVGQIKKGQALEIAVAPLHEGEANIFEGIFSRSWKEILSPDAKKIISVIPLFATSVSRVAIKTVSNIPSSGFDKALGSLVEMSLVDASGELDQTRKRYSIHPLTRAFAMNKFSATSEAEQEAAKSRMAQHFCGYAKQHSKDEKDNFDLVEEDLDNILESFDYAYEQKEWKYVIEFLEAISEFLDRRGYWDVRVRLCERAMEAANQAQDYDSLGWIQIYHQGWSLLLQEKYSEAKKLIEAGLNNARGEGKNPDEKDNAMQVALACRNLGVIALEEKDYAEAQARCEESLNKWSEADTLDPKIDPRRGRAMTLGTLGNIAWEQEDYYQAWEYYLEQKETYQLLDNDPYGQSVAWANLAICAAHLGLFWKTLRCCRNALFEFRRTGRTDGPGYMLELIRSHRKETFPSRRQRLLNKLEHFEAYRIPSFNVSFVYFFYLLQAIRTKFTRDEKRVDKKNH